MCPSFISLFSDLFSPSNSLQVLQTFFAFIFQSLFCSSFVHFFGHLMSCSSYNSLSYFSIFLTSHQTLNCFHPGFQHPLPNLRWQSQHGFILLFKCLFLFMPFLSPKRVCVHSLLSLGTAGNPVQHRLFTLTQL